MHAYVANRKKMWKWIMSAGVGMALVASSAVGQSAVPAPSSEPALPQARLNAEVFARVAQDTVTITLAHEVNDKSRSEVAKSLSAVLDKVLAQAREVKEVRASSGNYQVWPYTDKNGKISNWRGRAEVILESQDFAAAADLASTLGEHMPVAGLTFSVSDKLRGETEASLLTQGAQAFREKASALTHAFGYGQYEIRSIELSGSSPGMPRFARSAVAMAAEAAPAPLPMEGGEETITLSVQGTIVLLTK